MLVAITALAACRADLAVSPDARLDVRPGTPLSQSVPLQAPAKGPWSDGVVRTEIVLRFPGRPERTEVRVSSLETLTPAALGGSYSLSAIDPTLADTARVTMAPIVARLPVVKAEVPVRGAWVRRAPLSESSDVVIEQRGVDDEPAAEVLLLRAGRILARVTMEYVRDGESWLLRRQTAEDGERLVRITSTIEGMVAHRSQPFAPDALEDPCNPQCWIEALAFAGSVTIYLGAHAAWVACILDPTKLSCFSLHAAYVGAAALMFAAEAAYFRCKRQRPPECEQHQPNGAGILRRSSAAWMAARARMVRLVPGALPRARLAERWARAVDHGFWWQLQPSRRHA